MLNKVSAGIASVPDVVDKPLIPSSASAVQVKVTPLVGLDKLTATVVSPLVINCSSSEKFTCGDGLTVIENISDSPSQLISLKLYKDVAVIFAVIGAVLEFVVVKLGIFPVPDVAKPISVLLFVHM